MYEMSGLLGIKITKDDLILYSTPKICYSILGQSNPKHKRSSTAILTSKISKRQIQQNIEDLDKIHVLFASVKN